MTFLQRDVLAQWRLMMEFFCSVETVDRMFLRFPCPVKTDRSFLSSQNCWRDLPLRFGL